jgi:hypothetical protein
MRYRKMADLKWLALIVCCVASIAQSTDDLESLDAEFLSYLAEFEREGDDWTIVAPANAQPDASPTVKTPKAPAPEAMKTPPAKTPTRVEPEAGSER